MLQVLHEIVAAGTTQLSSGEAVNAISGIDPACGHLLQKAIREVRPRVAVEVGLAFGISTLYILEALREVGAEKLIGIDPAQHDATWRGGGLFNVKRAGYEDLYEFHERPSEEILPALMSAGTRIEFAFIDGWHTFDHVLLDFFYIDKLLTSGGIVVLDDVACPSIRRVCDFVLANLSYEIYDSVELKPSSQLRKTLKRAAVAVFGALTRTDKTPPRHVLRSQARIENTYFLALRKTADDTRRWDHFNHF